MTVVFVYGTLKRGEYNNRPYMGTGAVYLGPALTKYKYAIIGHHQEIPRLCSFPQAQVRGDLYSVDDRTLAVLDRLEANDVIYKRRVIAMNDAAKAWTYFYIAGDEYYKAKKKLKPEWLFPVGKDGTIDWHWMPQEIK